VKKPFIEVLVGRFNPLLVGARSAPLSTALAPWLSFLFQSPSCRGEERSVLSFATLALFGQSVSIPFLSGRGALRTAAANPTSDVSIVSIPFLSGRGALLPAGGSVAACPAQFQSPSCRGEERSAVLALLFAFVALGFNPLLVGARSAPQGT